MAARREHEPGYNSWEARIVRKIDATGTTLKSVWDHMALKRGPVVGLATAALLGLGSIGTTTIGHLTQDGPTGGTERIIDHDISGDAYMARGYSYTRYQDENYVLIEDEERFELYQWNDELRDMTLINFDTAASIISDITSNEQNNVNTWTGSGKYTVYRASCDLMYEPEENKYGQTTRVMSGCEWVSEKSPTEVIDIFEDNLAFWQNVDQNLTEANYGPEQERITPYQALDYSNVESYGEKLTDTAQIAFGGWLALGMMGAGISGIRRRAEKKINGPS
jgi:hypothetical protein